MQFNAIGEMSVALYKRYRIWAVHVHSGRQPHVFSAREYRMVTGASRTTAWRDLQALKELGLVKITGDTHWRNKARRFWYSHTQLGRMSIDTTASVINATGGL